MELGMPVVTLTGKIDNESLERLRIVRQRSEGKASSMTDRRYALSRPIIFHTPTFFGNIVSPA